jgi:hypothetical protein
VHSYLLEGVRENQVDINWPSSYIFPLKSEDTRDFMGTTAEFRTGMTIRLDGELYTIVEFQHVNPGNWRAFVRAGDLLGLEHCPHAKQAEPFASARQAVVLSALRVLDFKAQHLEAPTDSGDAPAALVVLEEEWNQTTLL